MKQVCVISDNEALYQAFRKIIEKQVLTSKYKFAFFTSEKEIKDIPPRWNDELAVINLKEESDLFLRQYDLFISLHSKQIFPADMVQRYRCINIHPGYNPYNRGWYPQVFSIINKKPVGVTIHEMDTQMDHGPIIYRERIEIEAADTSGSVYQKIYKKECELLALHLEELIEGNYRKSMPEAEGNINYKQDFKQLCLIDMDKAATYREVIDFLRAMTFDGYYNAYFIDEHGDKIYVKLDMDKQTMTADSPRGGEITNVRV